MPEVRAPADIESVLVAYLKADVGVTALVPAAQISTELRRLFDDEETYLQLFRTGGPPDPDDTLGYLDRPSVQVNAFGGTKPEAWDLAAETVRALSQTPTASHAGAVITAATRILGPLWSPDPDSDAARYIIGFTFTVHPPAA